MKKPGWRLLVALFIVAMAAWFTFTLPDVPTRVVTAEVVALEDGEDGWRAITVKFKDGRTARIETLAPFFYRPGYTAHVAVYENFLLPDRYEIVNAPSSLSNP